MPNQRTKWIALVAFLALTLTVSCGKDNIEPSSDSSIQNAEGLQINVLKEGNGKVATAGSRVTVHYSGFLMDGKKFDSSLDRGQPFTFLLGAGQVIKGWDQGIQDQKVGTKLELLIPPEMAYGSRGAGGVIPPNATLKFEVEILDVESTQ